MRLPPKDTRKAEKPSASKQIRIAKMEECYAVICALIAQDYPPLEARWLLRFQRQYLMQGFLSWKQIDVVANIRDRKPKDLTQEVL